MILSVIFLCGCLTHASTTSIANLRERYERAIAADPNDAKAHCNLGNLLEEHFEDFKGAREHYERCIAIDSNDTISHFNLGFLLEDHFKDFKGAREHYETSIAIDPNHAEAHDNLGSLLEDHFKEFNGAREHYETCIAIDPNHAEAHVNLGTLLEGHFKDFNGAREHYEKAIAIDPNYTMAHVNLGNLLEERFKDFNGAREHYETSIEIDPNDTMGHVNLGVLLVDDFKDFNGAREHYEKSIAIDPNDIESHFNLGNLLKDHFKDFNGAREHFERVREINPKDMVAHINFLDEETNIKILHTSTAANLVDTEHFRHDFYKKLKDIRKPHSKISDERSQFIRPLLCTDVKSNFQSLTSTLHKSDDHLRKFAKNWLSLYISICSISYTPEDLVDEAKSHGLEAKHLVSLLEIVNEFRIFLIHRDDNKEKRSLTISYDCELMEKIGVLSTKFYTMERESGGPYYDINAAFQEDRVEGVLRTKVSHCFQPNVIVSFGFQFLYAYHKDRYGLQNDVLCWRGMKELTEEQWKSFEINGEFYWPSFVSTSLDQHIAEKFCRLDFDNDVEVGPKSVLFQIRLPRDAFALSLAKISALAEENEILLFPYHKFRVKHREDSNTASTGVANSSFKGRGIVHLDCVGCAFSSTD